MHPFYCGPVLADRNHGVNTKVAGDRATHREPACTEDRRKSGPTPSSQDATTFIYRVKDLTAQQGERRGEIGLQIGVRKTGKDIGRRANFGPGVLRWCVRVETGFSGRADPELRGALDKASITNGVFLVGWGTGFGGRY